MAGWDPKRAAGGAVSVVAVAAAAWAVFALAARAQFPEPDLFPSVPTIPLKREGEKLPPLYVPDSEDVQPAQLLTPAGPAAPGAATPARTVPDPPPPVVRIQVRVPADAPPA